MTCATCPNCGFDLSVIEHLKLGDLDIIGNSSAYWRAHRVKLTPSEMLIVVALARSNGAWLRPYVLADVIGNESSSPGHVVNVLVSRIRKAFREIDQGFDQIEAAGSCYLNGLRWKLEDAVADLRRATKRERQLHKALLLHPGLKHADYMELLGFRNRNAFCNVLYALGRKGLARREKHKIGAWKAVGSLQMHADIEQPLKLAA